MKPSTTAMSSGVVMTGLAILWALTDDRAAMSVALGFSFALMVAYDALQKFDL